MFVYYLYINPLIFVQLLSFHLTDYTYIILYIYIFKYLFNYIISVTGSTLLETSLPWSPYPVM